MINHADGSFCYCRDGQKELGLFKFFGVLRFDFGFVVLFDFSFFFGFFALF